ncbi:DmsC/YnfH family molybdoenzyme membrane anchor subunit [Tessaracoccus sp. MC1756]|uniref:dimethyl sulfoxide reductase anchor subunit family protein n=1 Tax=Tessaracoccus sp. MC1756 TaxID=2760311 RepID=UPI0016020D53|nr:DmsC/YnfH family molybdoenzyme membrane anchor subunit [Tessaracoccus sp. MC1756]MBB1509664.1 dimethyl sulfoxide reductase anchor subunit [Tessaracoccus sp. MC1756]
MLHELPLVIFTICAQMSVGSFIALGIIQLAGSRVPAEAMERVTRPALYAIGPLLVLGLAASTLHLGSPLRAPNAILHWDGSWLSREILSGMAFLGLGAAFAVTEWFKLFSYRLRQVLAAATALVGIFLVYAISQVYSLRTVPAWATVYTPVRFFTTTLLLGGLAVAAALVITAFYRQRKGADSAPEQGLLGDSVRGIALGAIIVLGVKFVGLPLYLSQLAQDARPAAQRSLELLGQTYGAWSTTQTVLIFLGVAILGYLLFHLSGGRPGKRLLPVITLFAFALVLAGEVIGRMLFYASMVRVGV